MIDAGIPQMLRNHPSLLTKVHDFNCHVARHIHSQRFTQFLPLAILSALCDSRRGERKLSRWAVEQWQLSPEGIWDFQEPYRRVALLLPTQMDRLIRYLSATVHTAQISRAIDRRTLTQFKEVLGEEAYTFAIKRAPLLSRLVPESLQSSTGIEPERMLDSGLACLGMLLADCPAELIRRTTLKLEENQSIEPIRDADSDTRQRLWSLVKRLTLTEISPEFAPCFN
ncbi:hypothetical protein GC197_08975 [bacterium]|nr:hypothetical protein [bacterium]